MDQKNVHEMIDDEHKRYCTTVPSLLLCHFIGVPVVLDNSDSVSSVPGVPARAIRGGELEGGRPKIERGPGASRYASALQHAS